MIARPNTAKLPVSTNTTASSGNPFCSHDVENLYPETVRRQRSVETAPETTELKKTKATTGGKMRRKANALTAGTCVERRAYQIRAAKRMLHLFTKGQSQQHDGAPNKEETAAVGSILLQGSSESGKMVTTLIVARRLQQQYGLTVAWASNSRRIAKLRRENSELGFDLDIQYIDLHDWDDAELKSADLLILDQGSLDDIESVDRMGEQIDPRIVIGLTSGYFLKDEIRQCFDGTICMTAKVRRRPQDRLPKQSKLPHMPIR